MAAPDEVRIGPATLALHRGDITAFAADAIVNAANSALAGGGGVDGAIHHAGGPEIAAELRARYRGCPTGGAVATGAGRLPARWVIHAVGPVWRGGSYGEPALLESAYRSSLRLATDLGATTIALPAISAGIYRFPLPLAAEIAVRTVAEHLQGTPIERATFVLRGYDAFAAFRAALTAQARRAADA